MHSAPKSILRLLSRPSTGPRLAFRGQLPEVLWPTLGDAGTALAAHQRGRSQLRLPDQVISQRQRRSQEFKRARSPALRQFSGRNNEFRFGD